ncbi:MAG: hypothetical protein JNG89_21780, partial [Planctomycetaceae bacterium]|nr:hypothetical protein [Planctomycetaceae bacterium]
MLKTHVRPVTTLTLVAPLLSFLVLAAVVVDTTSIFAAELRAGAAKVDISHPDQPVSGTMYSRAIVLTDGETTVALI